MTNLIFLGSGDAFSAGGRFYSSLLIVHENEKILVDVGPTTTTALRKLNVSFNEISYIFITHSHGDHVAGLPFLFLEFQYRVPLKPPITIVGAPGIEGKLENLTETMYESLSKSDRRFQTKYLTLENRLIFDSFSVEGFPMSHEPLSLGYRFHFGNKILAITGDTEWNMNIPKLAEGADLLIIECSFFDLNVPGHLSYRTIDKRLNSLKNDRTLLYHLGQDVLKHTTDIKLELAQDFMEIEL